MIRANDTIRGDKLGKRANDWYIWIVCPKCLTKRWVLKWKLKLPTFTGLCQLCNGKQNRPRWNNGVMTSSGGYICISKPDHPEANSKGYVRRSRLVLEEKMGRLLSSDCLAHHLNGVKDDDRPSNLIEIHKRQHHTLHAIQRRMVREAQKEVVGFVETFFALLPMPRIEGNPYNQPIEWQAFKKERGIE